MGNAFWIFFFRLLKATNFYLLSFISELIHRQRSALRVFHHLFGLLLKPLLFLGLGCERDAMRLGVVVLIQIGEGGEAIGGSLFRLAAAVHLGIDGKGRAPHVDHLALEGDDVASEDGKLEIDAVKHQ